MSAKGNTVQLNREYTPEVRIRDLVFHILYRWRSILLVTLLCALALGAARYFSVKAARDAGNMTRDELRYEQELADYGTDLANAQEKVETWRTLYTERVTYRDGSLLMQLDPDNAYAAERKYLVQGNGGLMTDVLAVYTGAMITDHDPASLEEAFGTTSPGYAGEVVSIIGNSAENSFRVSVYASSEEAARKGLEYVAGRIEEAGVRAQQIAPHTLQVIGESLSSGQVIEGLAQRKGELNDEIYKYRDWQKTAERNLSGVEENLPLPPGDPTVRWALAGAGLGLLAMIGIYLISFLRRGKLRSGDEISEQYGVPVFGEMNRSGARRPGRGIDGWLEKRQFRKNPATEAEVYDNAAALIRAKREEGTLLLAGTAGADVLARVKAELEKRLGTDAGMETRADFPAAGGSAEDAVRAGSVVWVEEKHGSRSTEIQRAAELFEAAGTKVIGALVV